jgi:hypothetical protein
MGLPSLTIQQLFTPAPSGVDPQNPTAAPPAGSWRATLYTIASTIGLSTTSWLTGGITRTILALLSVALNAADNIVSIDLQGGFLDWAAAVTPDPATVSAQNWTPGWLDELALSRYNQQRQLATYAPVTMQITSTNASPFTYAPGTYHVANPSSGATYSNINSLTILAGSPSSPTPTTASFQCDQLGPIGTAAPGQINVALTAIPGVSVTNPGIAVGANNQTNASLVAQCRASLPSLSSNPPKVVYQFLAEQSFEMLQTIIPGEPATPLVGGPITSAICITDTDTGETQTIIANSAGTMDGVANLTITGATNASPIVLTVDSISAAGGSLRNDDWCYVAGVTGNSAANGWFPVQSFTDTSITLAGSAGSGNYVSGGSVEAGDLGLVDYILQAYAVGNADVNVTEWATDVDVVYGVTIWVPLNQVGSGATSAQTIASNAIASYIGSVPIGGYLPPVTLGNAIPIGGVAAAIAEALADAGITVKNLVGAFFIGAIPIFTDLPISPTGKPVLVASPVNVIGV